MQSKNRSTQRHQAWLFSLLVLILLPGCAGMSGFGLRRNADRLAGSSRPVWADDPQVEEVVDHLNRNVEKLHSWRANNIRIKANNIPLSGQLAVERGSHLRLVVNSLAGSEVDLGSNDDLFWIWAKRMPPPEYVYCRHEHTESVRQAMGIPFEPDWLMQALGVSPLSTAGMTLESDPQVRHVRLVQQVTSAGGQPLRKVAVVSLERGVITEHSIYDYNGRRIAVAKLDDHHVDKESGAILPRRIKLDWPQNEMSLVMNLGEVKVNPRGIPNQIWEMPQMPGYQMVDLGAMLPAETRVADNSNGVPRNTIRSTRSGLVEKPIREIDRAVKGVSSDTRMSSQSIGQAEHQEERIVESSGIEFLSPEFDDDTGRVKLNVPEDEATEGGWDSDHDRHEEALSTGSRGSQVPLQKKPVPRDWWNE